MSLPGEKQIFPPDTDDAGMLSGDTIGLQSTRPVLLAPSISSNEVMTDGVTQQ